MAYLSKSDFKVARTCATKLYYKKLGYPSALEEDEYLEFLADGGYMVEKIAKLLYPEGREIGFDSGPEVSAQETIEALKAENVTLFEATLISGGKLARVDILKKRGNAFVLVEVKAKSINSDEGPDFFRGKKGGIIPAWQPYLEDVGFQAMVLRKLFPKAKVRPFLCLVDKAKTTDIDTIFSQFEFPNGESIVIYHLYPTLAEWLGKEIPDEVNPRSHDLDMVKSGVAREIRRTIEEFPEDFFLANRGATVIADSLRFDASRSEVEIVVTDPDIHGLADGATSDAVIGLVQRAVADGRSFRSLTYDEIPDNLKKARFHVEVIVGITGRERIGVIARGRNTSRQVKSWSLADFKGAFDWMRATSRRALRLLALEKHAVKDNADVARVLKTARGELDENGDFSLRTEHRIDDDQSDPLALQRIIGGKLVALKPDEALESFQSNRPSPVFTGFLTHLRRDSALGVLPYEFAADSSSIGGAGLRLVVAKAGRRFSYRQLILTQRLLRPVWAYVIGDAIATGALPSVNGWWRVRFQKPARVTVDAGREAQQNRADVEMGLKTLEESYAELGLDFEEQAEIRAQNARVLLDLAKKYDVPLELLWKPTGGTAATPVVANSKTRLQPTGSGSRDRFSLRPPTSLPD